MKQGEDLNGDGDIFDHVIHIYDTDTGTAINLGLATISNVFIEGNFVVFGVRESWQGEDLNGNGDTENDIIHTYDLNTETITNWGLDVWGDPMVGENLIALNLKEYFANQDVNEDGDKVDDFAYVIDLSDGTVTRFEENSVIYQTGSIKSRLVAIMSDSLKIYNADTKTTTDVELPICCFYPLVEKDLFFFAVGESRVHLDLNGDGDISSDDKVLHVFDYSTGAITNLELALSFNRLGLPGIWVDNGRAFFAVNEFAQGNGNLNNDGDSQSEMENWPDDVLHMFDANTGTLTNIGLAIDLTIPIEISGNLVYFGLSEHRQGGIDTNGNLSRGTVIHMFDISTGAITNIGLDLRSGNIMADSNFAVFGAYENSRIDLNGDGDPIDSVLYVFNQEAKPFDTTQGLKIGVDDSVTLFDATISGNVVAESGNLVLIKSIVNGDITVTNGGILSVAGSTMNNVTTQDAKSIFLYNSQIVGDTLSINDEKISMKLNTINGDTIISGVQSADISSNDFGQLFVQNNGDVDVEYNEAATVLKITDNLSCYECDNSAPDIEINGCEPSPDCGGGGGI